jgi:hypothetical protein
VLLKSPASTMGIPSHFSARAFAFSSSMRIWTKKNQNGDKKIENGLFRDGNFKPCILFISPTANEHYAEIVI